MMMLFIVKEVSGTINHLESAASLNYEMYSIFLGTQIEVIVIEKLIRV